MSKAEDAKETDLQSKSKLQQLVLVFTQENHCPGFVCKQRGENVAVSHELILENLQPNNNLRELIVIGCQCRYYPKGHFG